MIVLCRSHLGHTMSGELKPCDLFLVEIDICLSYNVHVSGDRIASHSMVHTGELHTILFVAVV